MKTISVPGKSVDPHSRRVPMWDIPAAAEPRCFTYVGAFASTWKSVCEITVFCAVFDLMSATHVCPKVHRELRLHLEQLILSSRGRAAEEVRQRSQRVATQLGS